MAINCRRIFVSVAELLISFAFFYGNHVIAKLARLSLNQDIIILLKRLALGDQMDYISHLDVISTDSKSTFVSGWSGYNSNAQDPASLTEQLQTTLDIEQLLAIYINAIGASHKVSGVELDTYHGKFSTGRTDSTLFELALPIQLDDRLMGRVNYYSSKPITDILLSSLSNYQKRLVFPLRNALAFWQLQQLALKDPLTNIGNRANYDDSIGRAICSAKRHATPFSLMVLDLDNFKQANDSYGHLVGDEILVKFTQMLRDSIRGTDQAFRFGGDEFAIILDGQDIDSALAVGERLQLSVDNSDIGLKFNVSVSVGCAVFEATDTTSSLFAKADKALYAAKRAGKNCIMSA